MNYPKPETLAAKAGEASPVYIAVPEYKKQKLQRRPGGQIGDFADIGSGLKTALIVGGGLLIAVAIASAVANRRNKL